MLQPRPDPVPSARVLVATLPSLIEQAAAARGPLKLAVYGMRAAGNENAPVDPQANATAIRRALERAGIEFLPESGSVRLRDPNA